MFVDESDVKKLEQRVNGVETMQAGSGIRIIKGPGGITITNRPRSQPDDYFAKLRKTTTGGVIELHREWTNTIQAWRLNERVVYKPTGSAYHLVYQCNDASATPTDVPGTSGKWTKITVWVDEAVWSKTTAYTTGQKVLHLGGIYTAAADSTGVEPGTNGGKWTFTADSLLGITSYPMQIDGADVYTPVAYYEQYDTRYEETADPDSNKLYFGQRKITRYLDGNIKIEVVSDLVEWATAVPHT